jgi:hypothetical protein
MPDDVVDDDVDAAAAVDAISHSLRKIFIYKNDTLFDSARIGNSLRTTYLRIFIATTQFSFKVSVKKKNQFKRLLVLSAIY